MRNEDFVVGKKYKNTRSNRQYVCLGWTTKQYPVLEDVLTGDVHRPGDMSLCNYEPVPETVVRYLNIYPVSVVSHHTVEEAMSGADDNIVARIRVEYKRGQFDD